MAAPTHLAVSCAAPAGARIAAQLVMELRLTLRRGESVLLTFLIPALILVFFTWVDVLPTGTEDPLDFLVPGVLVLSVMSTAMTGLAIATGFERSTGVLKRLSVTPLRRRDLVSAKLGSVLAVEMIQVIFLLSLGVILGWRPSGGVLVALFGMVLGTAAFAGIGMLMAGTLPALTTLALANAVYLVLLLLGGIIVPIDELPAGLQVVSRALPAGSLADIVHGAMGSGDIPAAAWIVLAAWAAVVPALAALRFRWD